MKAIKAIAINVLLVVVGLFVVVLLAEVVTAVFFPQKILQTTAENIFFTRYDPELGWANREGASGPFRPNPAIRTTAVRINSLGYRGGEMETRKPSGSRRIVVLGDSNTFGYGVDEKERYSELLAARLPGNCEVLNLGVLGYGTDQELLLFQREAPRFSPDIVVLGFSAGDVSDNMSSLHGGAGKPYFKLQGRQLTLKNTPVPDIQIFMESRFRESRAYEFLYSRSHLFRFVMYRLAASDLYLPGSVLEMSREEGMRTTVALIERLGEICKDNGCRLAVLLIPHEKWIAAAGKQQGRPGGYYFILKRMLATLGIPVIDMTDTLVERYGAGESVFLENDPVHLNARGNELAAKALYDGLVQHTLIEP